MGHAISLTQQGLYQVQTHLNINSQDEFPGVAGKILVGTVAKVGLAAIGLIEMLFFGMLSLVTFPIISSKHHSILTKRTWACLDSGLNSFNSVFTPYAEVTKSSHPPFSQPFFKGRTSLNDFFSKGANLVSFYLPHLSEGAKLIGSSLSSRFSKVAGLVNLDTNKKLARFAEELIVFGGTVGLLKVLLLITTNLFVEENSLALLSTAISVGAIFAASTAATKSFWSDSGLTISRLSGLGVLVGLFGEISTTGGGALGALVGGVAGKFSSSIGISTGAGFGVLLGSMGAKRGLIIGTEIGVVFAVRNFFENQFKAQQPVQQSQQTQQQAQQSQQQVQQPPQAQQQPQLGTVVWDTAKRGVYNIGMATARAIWILIKTPLAFGIKKLRGA